MDDQQTCPIAVKIQEKGYYKYRLRSQWFFLAEDITGSRRGIPVKYVAEGVLGYRRKVY